MRDHGPSGARYFMKIHSTAEKKTGFYKEKYIYIWI